MKWKLEKENGDEKWQRCSRTNTPIILKEKKVLIWGWPLLVTVDDFYQITALWLAGCKMLLYLLNHFQRA
uniref:Uncharacterized protein n=1 Tax=Rhizophora mucronata TaxID=61149 RepID=A0A2P2P6X7_RHIMU